MLHIMASTLVFAVMFRLTRGRKALSWLSAIIFTTHPVLVDIVPVIDRGSELLFTVFLLVSFVLFLNHVSVSARRGNWRLLASLFAYALALGSKELAVLLPFIICAYLFVFPSCSQGGGGKRTSLRTEVFQQIKICLPYFVVTAIYIVWRTYVLGGIGGYARPYSLALLCQITVGYFSALLFLLPLDTVVGTPATAPIGSLCVFFVLFVFLFSKRKIVLINMRLLRGTQAGKIAIFLFIWLLLPVGLFLATNTFFYRQMYFPVIPFSALLSLTIIEGFRLFMRRAAAQQTMANTRWLPYAGAGPFIIASGLAIYLLCFFWIARADEDWKNRGGISRVLLYKLSKVVVDLRVKATSGIRIYDLPAVTPSYIHRFYGYKPFLLMTSTMDTYLHLTNPDKIIEEISIESSKVTSSLPTNIDLEATMQPNNEIIVTCKTR